MCFLWRYIMRHYSNLISCYHTELLTPNNECHLIKAVFVCNFSGKYFILYHLGCFKISAKIYFCWVRSILMLLGRLCLPCTQYILSSRAALGLPSASREQMYLAYKCLPRVTKPTGMHCLSMLHTRLYTLSSRA